MIAPNFLSMNGGGCFRSCGSDLLSLHGESRQRRAKGRTAFDGGFPFGIPFHADQGGLRAPVGFPNGSGTRGELRGFTRGVATPLVSPEKGNFQGGKPFRERFSLLNASFPTAFLREQKSSAPGGWPARMNGAPSRRALRSETEQKEMARFPAQATSPRREVPRSGA